MKQIFAITRKELDNYFGSPMALIFVGIFLVAALYSFFVVSGFFGRNIADVRPLFQWMPVLLILLIATITMRQWSEEQQTGTLELLLTMPVALARLVIGKFLAVLALVVVALALTLSLPITVALIGHLDFGPVIGGYIAAILLAAAYGAIGLFVSSRTANQIVALMLTAVICGLFYFIGSSSLTQLVPASLGDFLRELGTGSRFESIERGVIDLRDLVYYLTITGVFLSLNVLSLESKRWSLGKNTRDYRFNQRLLSVLLIVNLVVFNVLLSRLTLARADLTQNGDYTLSPATYDILGSIQEPLLIRGYFSADTHPLIAPLLPQIRDLLDEYRIAAKGKLTVEWVDPQTNPALETEADQTYGIRPTPLQFQSRGKTSVVNAYLSILIRYGDQNQVLSLLDMIEVTNNGDSVDVHLRNPEYDLTSSIQRVLSGFQNIDAVLGSLKAPAKLTLYVTPNTLPDELKKAPDTIANVVNAISKEAGGRLQYQMVDVSNPASGVTPQSLASQYQIQPISAGFLSGETYYLHMVLEADGKAEVAYPSDISDAGIRTALESALKRVAPGFLHVVGIWTPSGVDQYGQQAIQQYSTFQQTLRKNYDVRAVDLKSGQVANDINALVIIAPQSMSDIERYAVDQYLMRGGSVFVAAGNYQIQASPDGSFSLAPLTGGLSDMLTSYGITVDQKLVLDTQNQPFPVPATRNVGGVSVQEIQPVNYAQFLDIRSDGMDQSNPSVASLPAITVNWASPISLDTTKLKDAKISKLLQSSPKSWVTTNTSPLPNSDLYPDTGFAIEGTQGRQLVAVAVTGTFSSFFTGKPSPFAQITPTPSPTPSGPATPAPISPAASFIAQSPNTARLVVVGSSEFIDDTVFRLSSQLSTDRSANSVQLVQNSVDWFLEDSALATIRVKGSETRLLNALSDAEKSRWEMGNYIFAILALVGLGAVWQIRRRSEKPMPLTKAPTTAKAQEGEA
jgi:ABC-2 type transport system permease protein